jgi:hypothetical protein
MSNKTAKLLAGLLALVWLVIQVGHFIYGLAPPDPDFLFWALTVSLVINVWLAASLFDHWRKPRPPAPPPM